MKKEKKSFKINLTKFGRYGVTEEKIYDLY